MCGVEVNEWTSLFPGNAATVNAAITYEVGL